jgi:hypothetical protein
MSNRGRDTGQQEDAAGELICIEIWNEEEGWEGFMIFVPGEEPDGKCKIAAY